MRAVLQDYFFAPYTKIRNPERLKPKLCQIAYRISSGLKTLTWLSANLIFVNLMWCISAISTVKLAKSCVLSNSSTSSTHLVR